MLNKAALKTAIIALLTPTNLPAGESLTQEQIASIDTQAGKWADAIDIFVKTGTVTHAPGTVQGITPGWSAPLQIGSATNGVIN